MRAGGIAAEALTGSEQAAATWAGAVSAAYMPESLPKSHILHAALGRASCCDLCC